MGGSENFYPGADYGLDPDYGSLTGYRIRASDLGVPSSPVNANQLKAVSDKLNTGVKTIEVSGLGIQTVGQPMKHMDTIPKQHWEEISRLRKLTGVNLTFHGPLIEPTGLDRQGNWSELERQHAETEFTSAVQRAQKMDPKGNLVVTIHTSTGLPEPRTIIKDEKGEEKTVALTVVNEKRGSIHQVPIPEKDFITGETPDFDEYLDKLNKEQWVSQLSNITLGVHRSQDVLGAVSGGEGGNALKMLKESKESPLKQEKGLEAYREAGIREAEKYINELNFAEASIKDSYTNFQKAFNEAYFYAEKEKNDKDLKKLDQYRNEIKDKVKTWHEDPEKLAEFSNALSKGIRMLGSLAETPKTFIPLEKFAIEKASKTFAGVALNSYKKFGKHSPIISMENPPMGSGLAKAEQIRKLVKESRNKFAERAVKELGMSKSQAKKEAEKLIGVTWDLGHINMLRKYGYKDKDLLEQTKKIAPYIKHVHLSDNFGLEHTELPMGMGNVPTKEHLKIIEKYNSQVKKIVETGDWLSPQSGLGQKTPVLESLRDFGSPVYSMQMAPYWNQAANSPGGSYFNMGDINPPIHHSTFGAGFSNLPAELGANIPGMNRLSETPND